VANDQMTMGALQALAGLGKDVPGDVSLVGFDDVPEATYSQPPLTTIRQDFAALGREAVRLVVAGIGGESLPPTLVPPRLVTRASTARPARPRRR
jgi:DNA-binding LacI/PurR family transcriptional regulator